MSGKPAVRRRLGRGVILALVLFVLGPVGASQAHDELTGTTPADGAELQEAPDEVRLEFSGEIATVGSVVTVEGPLGAVTDAAPQVEGPEVVQPLITNAPPGEYAVLWRVTSADGHPISGEFSYTLASAGIEAQGAPEDSAEPTSTDEETDSERDDAATTTQSRSSGTASSSSGSDRAADTAAAPARGDASGESGTPLWVWGVLALAVVTLTGLGAVAVRRR